MNFQIDVTHIIVLLITAIIIPFVKTQIVPLIKAKFTAAQWSSIEKWVYDGVKAAETFPQFTSLVKGGEQKFAYVLKCVEESCKSHNIVFDEDTIKNCIQSAWDDLYNALNPAAKLVPDEVKKAAIAASIKASTVVASK
jgi:hypothetical protein